MSNGAGKPKPAFFVAVALVGFKGSFKSSKNKNRVTKINRTSKQER
jgi:hypothetical protein